MPPLESLRFSYDSGSLIPPWAFCRRNLPRFLSLKSPRVLRYLRMLPTVEEEAMKPSFLRRTESFPFGEAGIPIGVFEFPPQASGSTEAFGSSWASRPILPGFGVLGFRFFFHRKEAPGYAYLLQVTATGWGLSKVEDLKANPSLFGESMDLSELSNGIP